MTVKVGECTRPGFREALVEVPPTRAVRSTDHLRSKRIARRILLAPSIIPLSGLAAGREYPTALAGLRLGSWALVEWRLLPARETRQPGM